MIRNAQGLQRLVGPSIAGRACAARKGRELIHCNGSGGQGCVWSTVRSSSGRVARTPAGSTAVFGQLNKEDEVCVMKTAVIEASIDKIAKHPDHFVYTIKLATRERVLPAHVLESLRLMLENSPRKEARDLAPSIPLMSVLCTTVHHDEASGHVYVDFMCEPASGGSLADHLKTGKAVQPGAKVDSPLEDVARTELPSKSKALEKFLISIVYSCLMGLGTLHRSGIVHRDVKPGNILLSDIKGDHIAKIADFGLSAKMDKDGRVSGKAGTLLYMAHEAMTFVYEQPRTKTAQPAKFKDQKPAPITYAADSWGLGLSLLDVFYKHIDLGSSVPRPEPEPLGAFGPYGTSWAYTHEDSAADPLKLLWFFKAHEVLLGSEPLKHALWSINVNQDRMWQEYERARQKYERHPEECTERPKPPQPLYAPVRTIFGDVTVKEICEERDLVGLVLPPKYDTVSKFLEEAALAIKRKAANARLLKVLTYMIQALLPFRPSDRPPIPAVLYWLHNCAGKLEGVVPADLLMLFEELNGIYGWRDISQEEVDRLPKPHWDPTSPAVPRKLRDKLPTERAAQAQVSSASDTTVKFVRPLTPKQAQRWMDLVGQVLLRLQAKGSDMVQKAQVARTHMLEWMAFMNEGLKKVAANKGLIASFLKVLRATSRLSDHGHAFIAKLSEARDCAMQRAVHNVGFDMQVSAWAARGGSAAVLKLSKAVTVEEKATAAKEVYKLALGHYGVDKVVAWSESVFLQYMGTMRAQTRAFVRDVMGIQGDEAEVVVERMLARLVNLVLLDGAAMLSSLAFNEEQIRISIANVEAYFTRVGILVPIPQGQQGGADASMPDVIGQERQLSSQGLTDALRTSGIATTAAQEVEMEDCMGPEHPDAAATAEVAAAAADTKPPPSSAAGAVAERRLAQATSKAAPRQATVPYGTVTAQTAVYAHDRRTAREWAAPLSDDAKREIVEELTVFGVKSEQAKSAVDDMEVDDML